MAQGALRLSKKSKTRVTKKQQNAKGAAPKIIKPKNINKKERQAYKLAKQHQAKLHSNTEKLVSSRVGHLEILKGSRRELEKLERAKKAKAQAKAKK
ncbi:unnamed protein product [Ambrosiozyma monospora]|uniref:Unnamed protein product n=1 Tax=Ambrosiozyma monospora TaxID=43982 RepID=A0A9W6YQQ6_AMBMO|nr:unnamed protein product [Ambrosiozyma monospora]